MYTNTNVCLFSVEKRKLFIQKLISSLFDVVLVHSSDFMSATRATFHRALSVGKALVMFPPLASSSAPPSSPFTSLLVTLTPYSCLYMLRPTIINLISPSRLHFLLPLSPSFFFCPLWHLSSMYSCLTLGLLVDPNRNETTVLWSNRYSYMLVTLLQEKSLSMLVNFVSDGPTVQIL